MLETSIEKLQFNKRPIQLASVCYYRSIKMPKASESAQHTVELVPPEGFSDQEETNFEKKLNKKLNKK